MRLSDARLTDTKRLARLQVLPKNLSDIQTVKDTYEKERRRQKTKWACTEHALDG